MQAIGPAPAHRAPAPGVCMPPYAASSGMRRLENRAKSDVYAWLGGAVSVLAHRDSAIAVAEATGKGRGRDDPRMRGGASTSAVRRTLMKGQSPHARGSPAVATSQVAALGTGRSPHARGSLVGWLEERDRARAIPACAGEPLLNPGPLRDVPVSGTDRPQKGDP